MTDSPLIPEIVDVEKDDFDSFSESLDADEKIIAALISCDGNKSQAAKKCGISRATIYNRFNDDMFVLRYNRACWELHNTAKKIRKAMGPNLGAIAGQTAQIILDPKSNLKDKDRVALGLSTLNTFGIRPDKTSVNAVVQAVITPETAAKFLDRAEIAITEISNTTFEGIRTIERNKRGKNK